MALQRTSPRPSPRDATIRALAGVLAALLLLAAAPLPAQEAAQGDGGEIDRLLEQLADPEQEGWQQIEDRIAMEWSKSGSPAADLLLQRGREAMEEGEVEAALEHFGALTDHAPDFAEGWNALATAHYRNARLGLALDAIRRTLAIEPRHFGAMIGLGTILEAIGEDEEALEVFRMVHEMHPHRPNVNEWIERLSGRLEGETL
jgi:Flp pilus assembly protein TadD